MSPVELYEALDRWEAWARTLGHDSYCATQHCDHGEYLGEILDEPSRPCDCHLSTMPKMRTR